MAAAFDVAVTEETLSATGKPVYPLERMRAYCHEHETRIGIITVPSYAAQEVADRMVAAGIKAIWNFASVHLNIPSNVALKNEDLASSLALLSLQIQSNRKDD